MPDLCLRDTISSIFFFFFLEKFISFITNDIIRKY
jgi:hypothetical protein